MTAFPREVLKFLMIFLLFVFNCRLFLKVMLAVNMMPLNSLILSGLMHYVMETAI